MYVDALMHWCIIEHGEVFPKKASRGVWGLGESPSRRRPFFLGDFVEKAVNFDTVPYQQTTDQNSFYSVPYNKFPQKSHKSLNILILYYIIIIYHIITITADGGRERPTCTPKMLRWRWAVPQDTVLHTLLGRNEETIWYSKVRKNRLMGARVSVAGHWVLVKKRKSSRCWLHLR